MSVRSLIGSLVLSLLLSGLVTAQGGYLKQDFPRYGLDALPVPKRWDAVPVQPTEEFIALSWAEELPDKGDRRERRKLRPTLDLVSLAVVPDPEGEEESSSGDDSGRARKLPVVSVDRYLKRVGGAAGWKQEGDTEQLDEKEGRERYVRRFVRGANIGRRGVSAGTAGWVFEWRTPERVQFLFGQCAPEDADEMIKIWRHMATKVKLVDPVEPDLSKWMRHYEKNPELKDPAFRLNVRARLTEVKGWKAEDTENYLIVFSTTDKALIRVLKRELEAIRRAYEEIFPPDQPVDEVSVLRVCKDQAEYFAYGGPAGSGGYWSPVAEELVFYDYQDEGQKRGSGKANSRIVLYHEAFHQYVHYAAGDLAPHSWFNEGTGDYFSGARFDRAGKVSAIGPNPWRVEAIQYFVDNDRHLSLRDLFHAAKSKYYANAQVAYAQGWSLVYFLRTSRVVAKRPDWAKIHPTYYTALKADWSARRAQLEADGVEKSSSEYAEAQQASRDAAIEAALVNVNLRELELAWTEFVHELDD